MTRRCRSSSRAGSTATSTRAWTPSMRFIERLATTPYGTDPEVDAVLDHAVVVFNPIQNPDGRVAGMRTNGNGFDLNRDYITQSQPEAQALGEPHQAPALHQVLDLHGYVTPTLVEATTVPHNPGIEYDIWLKWNQPRLDANQAGLASEGFGVSRPINNIPRTTMDPRGRDAAPGLGRLGPLLHRPVRPAARPRRADDRDVRLGSGASPATSTSAGSTGWRHRWSAAPAPCARRSWPCSPRSRSRSRTAAR